MAGKTRVPHKEGCQCAVCKGIRAKAAREIMAPALVQAVAPLPSEVPARSLKNGEYFMFRGEKYRMAGPERDFLIIFKLNDTMVPQRTISPSTMVKLIK